MAAGTRSPTARRSGRRPGPAPATRSARGASPPRCRPAPPTARTAARAPTRAPPLPPAGPPPAPAAPGRGRPGGPRRPVRPARRRSRLPDHSHRQPPSMTVDPRSGEYRPPSIDATIDCRSILCGVSAPLALTVLPPAGARPAAGAARRGDLRGVVRLPGRADAGAAAARGRRRRPGGHGRRAHRAARDQPVHLLTPPPQARRRRVRAPAQGGHRHPGLGQPGLLHRPAARRRRRDGDARAPPRAAPTDLPADVTVRAMEPADWADVRRIYAEGIATGHADLRDRGPRPPHPGRGPGCPDHRWVAEIDGGVVGLGRGDAGVGPRLLRRRRRDLDLRRRGPPRPRRRQGADPPPGHRRRRRRAVDPADLDLPGEPGQHRPAPRPPASARSASANASAATTASGATWSSWSAAAPTTPDPSSHPESAHAPCFGPRAPSTGSVRRAGVRDTKQGA